MAYITETQQTILKLEVGRVLADSKLITGIINKDRGSTEKKEMADGVKYYEGKHDILNKDFRKYFVKGKQFTNENKANNKVVNAFMTDLVDQKADYILSNPPSITHQQEQMMQNIQELLKERFYEFLYNSAIGSSNKGQEWGHVFVNDQGQFDYMVIPAEQIIPDYDTNYGNKLLSLMRYYNVDAQDDKGKLVKRTKVEIWTDSLVAYYIETEKGEFILDNQELENPRPHWKEVLLQGDTIASSTAKGWGAVPFFPLLNNNSKINDLKRIKTLIDLYDLIMSNFGNDVEDRREMIIVIKNYGGQDNEELVQMLKETGVIKVTGDGGAESLELTIPVEAKNTLLKILEKNIYRFGRGFNTNDENFAGDTTGVALKMKYSGLDLKANAMIRSLKKYIKQLLHFWGVFNNLVMNDQEIEITFNKAMLANETEMIANVQASVGIVSQKTLLANHPHIKDVQAEIEQIQKENDSVNVNLDSVQI